MIGRTLAHYEIVALLGKGGMGEVYRARDPRLDRDVAVKVLSDELAHDPQWRRRFEQEARALAALSHPNIVPIFDFGVQDGTAFAVMELVEGRTLAAELRRGRVAPELAVNRALAMTRGLAAAHARGIQHRDLKPANLMLTPDGQLKILDFGLARPSRRAQGDDGPTSTIVGGLAGTAAYMAPECLAGRSGDERADLFAAGLVLHEMLSGANPFLRGSVAETISALLRDEAPDPPTAPAGLRALLRDCLQKDPDRRIRSAAELEARLQTCLGAAGTTIDSIAVLPFHNEADDEDAEVLIDGLTDSLIDTLSQLPRLKVLARSTVFQRRDLHDRPGLAGRELGVRAVLAGRLQRRGQTIVIRAELVDATDGTRLWGGRLQRPLGDLFEIEEQICQEITENLRFQLSASEKERLGRRPTGSAEAREAYMRGRFVWNRWKSADAMRTAIGFFERAIEFDPMYARAFAGLADSYSILGNVKALPPEEAYPRARTAALQGLAIDDQVAELHSSLGFIQRFWEWDWSASRASFERALELNPGYATAHRFYAHLLSGLGEHDAAIERARHSLSLDPLSPILHTSVGDTWFYARRYDEAMQFYRRSLELDPGFLPGHTDLARALELAGRFEEALAEFGLAAKLAAAGPADPSAGLACVYASMGRREEALAIVGELVELARRKYISPYALASIHACLGDVDSALDWLETAHRTHDQTLVWVKVHPRLDPLRRTDRYAALLARMGL